ncbi:MAG: hypothetical protein ACOC29_01675 [Candidatus Sumerlaeota bacterium]
MIAPGFPDHIPESPGLDSTAQFFAGQETVENRGGAFFQIGNHPGLADLFLFRQGQLKECLEFSAAPYFFFQHGLAQQGVNFLSTHHRSPIV